MEFFKDIRNFFHQTQAYIPIELLERKIVFHFTSYGMSSTHISVLNSLQLSSVTFS